MQQGFTLVELMIVIAIIAILAAIGIPSYQGYLQKAALTDMLQLFQPYKIAVELCAIEQGKLQGCHSDSHGIPAAKSSRYVARMQVTHGAITLTGAEALKALTVELSPTLDPQKGHILWSKQCRSNNKNLLAYCQSQFHYPDKGQAND